MIENFFSVYNIDVSTLIEGDVIFYKGNGCFAVKNFCECLDCLEIKPDFCSMVECLSLNAGEMLVVNQAGDCIESAPIPETEDTCKVKVSEDDCCGYLEEKIVSNNSSLVIKKGFSNTPGCQVLNIELNPDNECNNLFETICDWPTEAPDCDLSFWDDIYPCVKQASECADCDEECQWYTAEFCPDLKKIRYKTDECCEPCHQAFRSKAQLESSYTISIANQKEYKYYLTSKRIPRLDQQGYRRIGGLLGGSFSELQGGGISATEAIYQTIREAHGSVNLHGAQFAPYPGDIEYTYKGNYETNKAIHGVKNVVIAMECDGVANRTYELDSWRDSGIQGELYASQPASPDANYGAYGSNSTTSQYSGAQSGQDGIGIYSMGRAEERRGFIVHGRDTFEYPTRFIPGIKISSVITGDDEATEVAGQVSVLGGVLKGANYEDGARISIRCIDSFEDRKILRSKCNNCDLEACEIFDESSVFNPNSIPFTLPGTGGN